MTRADVNKLNASIADVEAIKEKICFLIDSINNSLENLTNLNNRLTQIEGKIQGIYEYKKYLDEIVEQVNRVKTLSRDLASSIIDNDNKVRNFDQKVQHAYNVVNNLNNNLSDVDNLKLRIASAIENINKSAYEINYLSEKITEIVSVTNEVIQTYEDAPMVKLTNIESDIAMVKKLSKKTTDIASSIIGNIQETIEDSISGMQNDVSEVKTIVDRALSDGYYYSSDSVYSKIDDVSSSISSLESKVEDVNSKVDRVKDDVRDIKYTVDNAGSSY